MYSHPDRHCRHANGAWWRRAMALIAEVVASCAGCYPVAEFAAPAAEYQCWADTDRTSSAEI